MRLVAEYNKLMNKKNEYLRANVEFVVPVFVHSAEQVSLGPVGLWHSSEVCLHRLKLKLAHNVGVII